MRYFVEARIAPHSATEFLAVRHGVEVVERDATWRESFSGDAWLAGGQGAPVTVGHDGRVVGHVVCVVARGAWHYADIMIEDADPDVVRVAQGVSIDARTIRRDDNELVHVRRHRIAKLDAVALVGPGEVPCYADAKITRVREAPARDRTLESEVVLTHGTIVRENIGVVLGVR